MNDDVEGSITSLLRSLQHGDEEAAAKLWNRYFSKIVVLAKKRLQVHERRVADEEDLAVSVFDTLCRGIAKGKFSTLKGRDELWKLLVVITHHKVSDKRRYAARKKRSPGEQGKFEPQLEFVDIIGREPTPDFLVMLDEENQRLLAMLRDDNLRRIAIAKMEGHSNRDIAKQLGVSVRTIDRKLDLVQATWASTMFI